MTVTPDLTELLQTQHGLASRAQLLAVGVTRSRLQWRLDRTWRAVLPGVVATFTGVLDPVQRLTAAQLYAGPDAVIGSWTAASWHGVEAARISPIIRVTVPYHRRVRNTGLIVATRTSRPDLSPWERGTLRISSRARAVVDAARDVRTERGAQAIIIEAVQRGIVTAAAIRHELECGPRQGSARVRRGIDAAEAGSWSAPEADLMSVLRASRVLPELWANPMLTSLSGVRLPTPDVWIDEIGLAVQVHSRAYHLRDQEWNATVATDSALGECGVVVLGVTPQMIASDPASIRLKVENAYRSLRGRPRPLVTARPRIAP